MRERTRTFGRTHIQKVDYALAGNRTPVSRLANENSATSPPMLWMQCVNTIMSREQHSDLAPEQHSNLQRDSQLTKTSSHKDVTSVLKISGQNWRSYSSRV